MLEVANNGTLLLDEIGEMPLNLQVKLLRALQEQEIYRIGGRKPVKLNVRIIEVGKGITEGNVFITSIVIGISVTIIILSSIFSEKLNVSNKLFRQQSRTPCNF